MLESGREQQQTKHMDLSTLRATFSAVIAAHYPTLLGRVALRLVACPAVCASSLQLLTRFAPPPLSMYIATGRVCSN